MKDALTRIAVFYDGNFFHIVSNYYAYHHPRKGRISISGLHEFIRARVAQEEHLDARLCQVVDAHYFRGRFSAEEVEDAGRLFSERVFDDVLVREGVTTHYLPMGHAGVEKGIDVWFALEAYELAIYKRFDVCVLVAGDSDYVPLVRKLNTLGTRVMVLGWDFEYTDRNERLRTTKTSQALLNEVTYPVLLSAVIEDKTQRDVVKALFLPSHPRSLPDASPQAASASGAREVTTSERYAGTIQNLIEREADNKHFGFISPEAGGENIWFGDRDLDGVAFSMLARGDQVTFELGKNWQGTCAKRVRREG
ncbi:MAG: NYN domain-containing protein [Deltaproteobacteria bacterium]